MKPVDPVLDTDLSAYVDNQLDINRRIEVEAAQSEGEHDLAGVALLGDRRREARDEAGAVGLFAEQDAVAGGDLLGRTQEGAPAVARLAHMQRDADARRDALAHPLAEQLGGDDAGVVENERIARPEQVGQLTDDVILRRRARLHDEQACRVARAGRPERDALIRKIEIEKVDAHRSLECIGRPTGARSVCQRGRRRPARRS